MNRKIHEKYNEQGEKEKLNSIRQRKERKKKGQRKVHKHTVVLS